MEDKSYITFLEEAVGGLIGNKMNYYKSSVDQIIEWQDENKPLKHSETSSALTNTVQKILDNKVEKIQEDLQDADEIIDEIYDQKFDINLNEDEEVILNSCYWKFNLLKI